MHYCRLEQADYPDDEFRELEDHGLVHYRGRPHTVLGDYIDEDPVDDAMDVLPPDERPQA